MRIISLEIENVKKIRAATIKPDGSPLVLIGGKNDAGKSTVLDSILWAMEGGKSIDPNPIRTGQKKAKTVLLLGSNGVPELKVTQIITPSGERLTVENAEGLVYKSPQAILDALTGRLSFDPLAFANMKDQEQLEMARKLVGLDFTKDDMERKIFYEERTQVNREIKALEGRVAAIPDVEGPDEEVSVFALTEELDRRSQVNKGIEAKLVAIKNKAQGLETAIGTLVELRRQVQVMELNVTTQQAEVEKMKSAAASYVYLDLDSVREEIKSAEANNQKARSKKERMGIKTHLQIKRTEADNLTSKMEEIDQRKAMLISNANFPVEGMSFDENGVLYNGLPFKQEGTAGQIRISVAMGLAMNPKLKVILIRDGSLLDADNLAMIAKMAEDAEAHVWIEVVREDGTCSVIIENGMVKENV